MTLDTDWQAEMERWRHGINVETATDEDIADFTIYKLWEYKEYETMDIALWSFFQDDFGKFDVNTFSRIHAQRLKSMYNFLRRVLCIFLSNDAAASLFLSTPRGSSSNILLL